MVLCWLFVSNPAVAAVNTLLLVPETQGAAKKIYDEVVAGISSNEALSVSIAKLNKKSTPEWVSGEINYHNAKLVIAVGNMSYKLAQQLDTQATIVAGGISGKPNGIPTLSLTGAPLATLQNLQAVVPAAKNVYLVYNEKMNGWWYRQAQIEAQGLGLTIIGYKANSLKEGVRLYEKLLNDATESTSAVWIPLRGIVPSKTILPLLLEKAWAKKFAVISNNPAHTKLGGLLAVYPNHKGMGIQLADFALAHHEGNSTQKIVGTSALRKAINLRTSSHLGLRFSAKDRAQFNKAFPLAR
jgi:putative ABC transport system substrate-binding protein